MTKLQSLSVHNCVRLLWTPGHSDIEWNEITDSLAKQAAIYNGLHRSRTSARTLRHECEEHCSPTIGSRTDQEMEQYSELSTSEADTAR